jgi:hypothetical protein
VLLEREAVRYEGARVEAPAREQRDDPLPGVARRAEDSVHGHMLEHDLLAGQVRDGISRQALEDDYAAAPRQRNGGRGAVGSRRRLEHEIEARAERVDRVAFAHVDRLGCSQPPCEGETAAAGSGDREPRRRRERDQRHREEPERAGADDRGRDPGPQPCLEQSVRNARGRLEQRGGLEVAPLRQDVCECGRHHDVLGERAGVREAGLRVFGLAEIRASLAAPVTQAARPDPFRDDDVAGAHSLDARPDGGDRAGPLVARDDRVAHVLRRARALEELDVGSADPCGADADEDLAVTGLGYGQVDDADGAGPLDEEGPHRVSVPAFVTGHNNGDHTPRPTPAQLSAADDALRSFE